jgi:hypothetical protein
LNSGESAHMELHAVLGLTDSFPIRLS